VANELFDIRELRQPLTPSERMRQVHEVVRSARLGVKYVYSMREVCGILHWSKDQVYDALHTYKIDGFYVLSLVRIAWWSLAEYLLDPADDMDNLFYELVDSLPRKESGKERVKC